MLVIHGYILIDQILSIAYVNQFTEMVDVVLFGIINHISHEKPFSTQELHGKVLARRWDPHSPMWLCTQLRVAYHHLKSDIQFKCIATLWHNSRMRMSAMKLTIAIYITMQSLYCVVLNSFIL